MNSQTPATGTPTPGNPGSAPEHVKTSAETFLCQNCGGTMRWNISRQSFECTSCRTPGEIQNHSDNVYEHPFEEYAQRAAQEVSFPELSFVICQHCGAEVTFEENQTATICPMCSSSQVNLQKQTAGVPPDGIIPFRVDKPQAQEVFKKWVKSRWFAPNRLKKAYQDGKLDGLYLPFWTYDADASASYRGQGGRTVTTTDKDGKPKTTVTWTPVSGHVSNSFDDVQVCAAHKKAQEILDALLPYNTSSNSSPYAGAYLSGFMAERYSLGADAGFETAKSKMEQELRRLAEMEILSYGYDTANIISVNAQYVNIHYKHILLPAWTSSFAFNGKEYLYAINGETGQVSGQRPYSVPKIVATCLLGLAIVLFFLLFFSDDAEAAVPPCGYSESAISAQATPDVDRLDSLIFLDKEPTVL